MENTTMHGSTYAGAAVSRESLASAVSWGAVIAGAFVAASLSLLLLAGGTGLGFASMSPWAGDGASAMTLGIAAIVWLIVTQAISAGLGGYLAGRLRTKWVDTHTDEVYFRDTAHGFLVWAVGAVISAMLIGSGVSAIVSGTARVGASAVSGMSSAVSSAASSMGGASGSSATGSMSNSANYLVDSLFRSDRPDPAQNGDASRTEVGRIIAMSIANGQITPDDKTYVAKVISARTGVDQATAEKRIDDTLNRAKQAADTAKQKAREAADAARKAAAAVSLWAFVSLLIGAFCASFAATIGGRSRDKIG